MAQIALYRMWRPQFFRDVVGQKHIVRTIQNSLKEGRVSHAYLFSGPRGTGKTSTAKILAKAVNCELGGTADEPCNQCSACLRITEGSVMDVIEFDAASNNGVDEIRDIRDKVRYAPTEVRKKVYIIDEVHMLSTGAFNALLKTLEEPPPHVMFILATTEPHKLPLTIVSRCQRFDFHRVSMIEQVEMLEFVCGQEKVSADRDALEYISRLSEGGMRDALSLLDQLLSYSGDRITYDHVVSMTGDVAANQFKRLAQAILAKDIGDALQLIDRLMMEGKSADKCMESMIFYFRDLLVIKLMPNSPQATDRILDASSFQEISAQFDREQIFQWIDILNHYQVEMKYSAQPQTLFEIAIMKICSMSEIGSLTENKAITPAPQIMVPDELVMVKQRLVQLEQQLLRFMQSASAMANAAFPSSGSAGGQSSANVAHSLTTLEASKPLSISPPAIRKTSLKLDGFLASTDTVAFKQLLQKWNQVLTQVKEQKITIHAWLVNGEPVALKQNTVLLSFKSSMHRETTEKPVNRQMIEQVISTVMGAPMTLVTVMQKDWKETQDNATALEVEVLQPEPQEPGVYKEEWINQAIDLFGEDMVEIKED